MMRQERFALQNDGCLDLSAFFHDEDMYSYNPERTSYLIDL
jgi:hypothetical protein